MFPGFSQRDLKKMLKKWGINVVELEDVERVVIQMRDKQLVISSPQVMMFDAGAQKIYQIIGEEVVEEAVKQAPPEEEIEVNEEDVLFVAEQAGVSTEEARKALIQAKGDLAEAILILKEGKAEK